VRASYGTGAKAPSLYQLYDPDSGYAHLKPERSDGYDVGIEQAFLDGDARAGLTYFSNHYRQLIDWQFFGIVSGYAIGHYYNVNKAAISGAEVTGEYNLVPSFARLKLAYTRLDTRAEPADVTSADYGKALIRRPRDSARISIAFTPERDLTIEPLLRLVGPRADKFYDTATGDTVRVTLKSYARFDISADYKLNKNVSLFMRAENLTNVKYEDVFNYGTPGRSAYAGLQMTW
jgi:vitamin B12 transporter